MKIFIYILTLFVVTDNLYGQSDLNARIQNHLQGKVLNGSIASVTVKTLDNTPIIQINQDHLMIPASNMKIITTFLALALLGEDFTYTTTIGYDGVVDRSGTLNGNLYVIGSGDPSLGSDRKGSKSPMNKVFSQIFGFLSEKGINCIEGKILIDDRRFEEQMAHSTWPWSDVGNYYGGGVSGFNFRENEYDLLFDTRGKIGDKAIMLGTVPPTPSLHIESEVKIDRKGTGDNAYIYGGPGLKHKVVRGSLPQGVPSYDIQGSRPDPSLFFGQHLAHYLFYKQVSTNGYGKLRDIPLPEMKQKWSIESAPLSELVDIANDESINLFCEAFYKSISSEGSWAESESVANKYLHQNGMDTLGILQIDGSGLSPRNLVTTDFFTQFLAHFANKWGIEKTTSMLPRVSYEGTVKRLLRNSDAKGCAYLKSGYIGRVLTYSGYIKSKKGTWHSISMMVNQYRCKTSQTRSVLEKILEEVYLSL